MAKKKGGHDGGGHGGAWVITFADLVSLLMAFFVMLLSFSVQDQQKIAQVAGSMKEAFGVQPVNRRAGMIEREGLPTRDTFREVSDREHNADAEFATERNDRHSKQGAEQNTHDIEKTETEKPRQFATAAESLRQAWQDMPDIAELSKNILVEETDEGLEIQLVDQDGRTMFEQGAREPNLRATQVITKMAPVLSALPNTIRITGHTLPGKSESSDPSLGGWELSSDRAHATRRILQAAGVRESRFDAIVGKGATEPLFPNAPRLAANRRVSIVLIKEAPPLPATFRP